MAKQLKIIFIGDIFAQAGVETVAKYLPKLKEKYNYDFVIAQAENVSGRKGLEKKDYLILKEIGVDVFTMGNHVWAREGIAEIIYNHDVIRPANINNKYAGQGSVVFQIGDVTLRVTSMMGILFNKLLPPWDEEYADSFFDKFDEIYNQEQADFHLIDFHAETTSEKSVFSLYVDGKVSAFVGTHTHVQTNDARILPGGTAYITDVGMTGPANCAIGLNYQEVYEKMRFNSFKKFQVSKNKTQLNAVYIELHEYKPAKIEAINIMDEE